jgi:hypothetical protein
MHQRHRALLAKAQNEYADAPALTMARQLCAKPAALPAPARKRAHATKLLADNPAYLPKAKKMPKPKYEHFFGNIRD